MKIENLRGFTLVELIVVITILAILWAIAFVSVGNYSKSSRDSKRIANVTSMAKALEIALASDVVINTTETSTGANLVIIGSGMTMTGTYGFVNKLFLDSIRVYGDAGKYDGFQAYQYSYFPQARKYQIAATLEWAQPLVFLDESIGIAQAYASNTSTGTLFVKGNFSQTGGILGLIPDPEIWNNRISDPVTGAKTFSGSEMLVPGDAIGGIPEPASPPIVGTFCILDNTGSTLDSCLLQ